MGTLINLSNCKQEIRHHLRLFLSNKNDWVVLPAELCPAPSVDLIPPFTGLHSIFHTHQHLNYDLFHQVHFSRCRPRLSCLISTAAFSVFYQSCRECPPDFRRLELHLLRKLATSLYLCQPAQ